MTMRSCIYVGHVTHRRLKPNTHSLRHNVFWLLLDLGELDALDRQTRLFSHNRSNLIAFFDRDHGDGDGLPLQDQIVRHLNDAGLDTTNIKVAVLCMPRFLGYDFNPISVYYCTRGTGEAVAMVYEVNNTFHQRHMYVIPATASDSGEIRQRSSKDFYVSPFLGMDMSYAFSTALPGETVQLSVQGSNRDGPIINTSLVGRKRPLTDGQLARLLLTHPLLTLRVVGWIHWHAFSMWLKGFRLQDQPTTPRHGSTIVHSANREKRQ
ncbi:MAG: hypothetical protein RLZ98_2908 [Pseudomonadota bacterium]|jgi:DUF1365 family protein